MEWQPVKGWEGRYEVSDYGEVRRKDGTPVLVWSDIPGWGGKYARVCAGYNYGQWTAYGLLWGEPKAGGKAYQWVEEVIPVKWRPLPPAPTDGGSDA